MFAKRLSIILLLTALCTLCRAQDSLSARSLISVITCGPSQEEVYSAFGHSAIRVYDPEQNLDLAFNYGVFDFNQPNFYLNFARGFLYYKLGVYRYPDFRDYYIENDRFIHEQVLNLNPLQKQMLFSYLMWNAQPANQYYRYDYYLDNCATRVRDVLQTALNNEIVFDQSFIKTTYSFRDLTELYLTHQPWGQLGINICLGLAIDRTANPYEYMFLPDFIELSVDRAQIISREGTLLPLVSEKRIVFKALPQEFPWNWSHPAVVFSLLLGIILVFSFRDLKNQKLSRWLDALLFILTGVMGLFLLLLWFGTDHKSAMNFNLLWALPTNALAGVALIFRARWLRSYFMVAGIVYLATLVLWPVLPQQLDIVLIPLVIALLVRSTANVVIRT